MRLRVLEPCGEAWAGMTRAEDGASRHCGVCRTDVHDLRGLTEAEVLARVVFLGPAACVRVPVDERGESMFERAAGAARPGHVRLPMMLATALGAAVAACGAPQPASSGPPLVAMDAVDAGRIHVDAVGAGEAGEGDADGDGIADRLDACPTVPGPADADASRSGCPRVIIESMGMTVLPQIYFMTRAAVVLPESFPLIDTAVEVLAKNPEIARVEVEGHAAADEPDAKKLSEARARAVVARMVAKGVDAKRLVAKGAGSTLPIGDNATVGGRQQNRRVTFRIVESPP